MTSIDEISKVIIILIRAGAVFRVAFCFFVIMTNEDEGQKYKKRMKNVLFFYVLAELAFLLKDLIIGYYL